MGPGQKSTRARVVKVMFSLYCNGPTMVLQRFWCFLGFPFQLNCNSFFSTGNYSVMEGRPKVAPQSSNKVESHIFFDQRIWLIWPVVH